MKRRLSLPLLLLALFTLPAMAFQDSQQDLLAKLTGHEAINGKKLKERYTQSSKAIAADYLLNQLKFFCDEASIDSYSETGNNIVGVIKATTPTDEWVVFGAHYDTVRDCPGANDNGTGVALVNEVAKTIAAMKNRRYNTYIVYFDEEERGLLGSRAFAGKLKENGVKLHSAHTIDQMGWDKDGDRGIELELPHEDLLYHYEDVAEMNDFYAPIHTTNVPSTDHTAFRELGYKAIGITEEYKNRDTTPHYHRSTDTFETVNMEYLTSTTNYMKKVFEALLKPEN